MRLALIGRDISHSKSPELYRQLLGQTISYELIDITSEAALPSLADLTSRYDAINITSPYKTSYVSKVVIADPAVRDLGAINTILLNDPPRGTNTDLLAVRKILAEYIKEHGSIQVHLLGGGAMAKLTQLVCHELAIPVTQYARALGTDMSKLDFSRKTSNQVIVINSCSRKFIFSGKLNEDVIFWDYNYGFLPHQNSLPSQVKSYQDGLALLRIQGEEAVKFWKAN